MTENVVQSPPGRDFSQFRKTINEIVMEVTTDRRNRNANPAQTSYITSYSSEIVQQYIDTGNIAQLREISRYYFYRSGFYRRTLLYFGTMMLYAQYITPNINPFKESNDKKIMKKYQQIMTYADSFNLDTHLPRIVTKMFVDGAYFGLINEFSDMEISFRDLPSEYCRAVDNTGHGINILEFDVTFFDKITDKEEQNKMLKSFPKIVQKQHQMYKRKGQDYRWIQIPPNLGVAFTIGDQRPPMISVIPSIINLEEYRGLDRAKDEMDLHRIFVQKMPMHEGELVFTLEETSQIHKAVSSMLKDTKHIDVLTTFAEIDVPSLRDTRQLVHDNLEKVERSIYGEAGVSKEIFSPTRNLSLSLSIQNDLSYVMSVVNPIKVWFQTILRARFNDNSVSFDFNFLPVTYYNQKDMTDLYTKQANSGYSKLLPAIAAGVKQHQVVNLATFENDYLQILTKLVPLQTSYTQSVDNTNANPNGRPPLDDAQRTQKTDDNKQSGNEGVT